MAYEQMVIDRRAVEEELNRVFEPAVTQVVVDVLNRVAMSAVDVTRADLYDLRGAIRELAQAQARTEAALETLVHRVDKLDIAVGALKGWALEDRYRDRPWAHFGRLLRRLRLVPWTEVEDDLEARLTPEEHDDLLRMDLLLRGRLAHHPDMEPIWLAVEVSAVLDEHDVTRAQRRAALLRRAGYRAVPLAAGEDITTDARSLAARQRVALALDGQISFWDEALADVLAGG